MIPEGRRHQVGGVLLDHVRADPRVVGAAVTGSVAAGRADRWSDVDLFLGVVDAAAVDAVLGDLDALLRRDLGAVHSFDLSAGVARYRAFLLADGLEVDLGLAPGDGFRRMGDGAFEVVFGEPAAPLEHRPDADHLIGLCWHAVLHARSSIDRDRAWQAEHWISALRDHTLELACARLRLPTTYAKGAHLLPADVLDAARDALVHDLAPAELTRALAAAADAFTRELGLLDPAPDTSLGPTVHRLAAG